MNLVLLGLSHRSAPLEVRERYAVAPGSCAELDAKLVQYPEIDEAAILSTCNRTDIYAVAAAPDAALERLHRFLGGEIGASEPPPRCVYEIRELDVARHLFRVASSLDSMVLGEAQILGQVKQCYRASVSAGSCGPVLNRLFHRSFRAAKSVRARTGLGGAPVSVARVGVQLAAEVFESFEGKRILLVGAGEMAESALEGLHRAGAHAIAVANRSPEPARRLAERFGGRAAPLERLEQELAVADVALCSLGVDRPLIRARELEAVVARRQGRPLLLIDLGIPRNVEAEANRIEGLYLFDLDDLERVAERGRALRKAAVAPAEELIAREAAAFDRWLQALPLAPAIRELLDHAGRIARAEVRRTLPQLSGGLAGPSQEAAAALERMAQALVAKLLHAPLERLRAEAEEGGGPYYAEALRRLFGLGEPGAGDEAETGSSGDTPADPPAGGSGETEGEKG